MEKKLYLQPETKVLSLAVSGELCEPPQLSQPDMYGPPDDPDIIDEETPLF